VTRQPNPARRNDRQSRRDDADDPMMDIGDVAARLNTTVRHVRRLVAERRIPHHKIGNKLRFGPREIDEWIASSLVPARDTPGSQLHQRRWRAS
jgi:excisionase family DNA binding protein